MLKFFSLLIFTVANFTAIIYAQSKSIWEPPNLGVQSMAETEHPSGVQDLVSKIAIGSFNVVLEKTSLEHVGTHFSASIGHSGDAGESLEWVCLHGQDRLGQWILWIESGEIDGPAVGGFLLMRRSANNRLDNRCKPVDDGSISLPISLSLGMSRAQVVAALGPPTSQSGSHLFYYHHRVVKENPKAGGAAEPSDLSNTLFIRLNSKNEVDAFQVWRTTTS
jgi:hypothetical protein